MFFSLIEFQFFPLNKNLVLLKEYTTIPLSFLLFYHFSQENLSLGIDFHLPCMSLWIHWCFNSVKFYLKQLRVRGSTFSIYIDIFLKNIFYS